jgi:hypothetical protein
LSSQRSEDIARVSDADTSVCVRPA